MTSLLAREVVTESGRSLGRCRDLRGELTGSKLQLTALCLGRGGVLDRLGICSHDRHETLPWSAVVRIEAKRIVVSDDGVPR